ncbi:MAG: discoidin domain-containing protein [Massilia sp.]
MVEIIAKINFPLTSFAPNFNTFSASQKYFFFSELCQLTRIKSFPYTIGRREFLMLKSTIFTKNQRLVLTCGVAAVLTACGGGNLDENGNATANGSGNLGEVTSTAAGSARPDEFAATIMSSTTNLALNKTTSASSIEGGTFASNGVVDERLATRWASARTDSEWIQVDLGAAQTINSVSLTWETAFARAYNIQTSTDNATWKTVYSTSTGVGGTESLSFPATTARFVRMAGVKRATQWGYSLYEFRVYNDTSTGGGGGTAGSLPTDAVFSPTSFWYTKIPAVVSLHPNSNGFKNDFLRQIKAYYGNVTVNTNSYASPVYTAAAGTATKKVQFWDCQGKGYADAGLTSQWASVPIPAGAQPSSGTDGEMTVYQPSTDTIWEFWQTKNSGGTWQACWGGRLQNASKSQGIWPASYGTTATGLPFLGGQITAEELARGEIRHAIGIALVDLEKSSVVSWPAARSDGYNPGGAANRIPEGLRFRLDPSVNVDALSIHPVAKIIAKAAQKYGFVVWDKAGAISVRVQNPKSYTALGKTDPYKALFGGTAEYALLNGFPWDRLQFLPMNYGKP